MNDMFRLKSMPSKFNPKLSLEERVKELKKQIDAIETEIGKQPTENPELKLFVVVKPVHLVSTTSYGYIVAGNDLSEVSLIVAKHMYKIGVLVSNGVLKHSEIPSEAQYIEMLSRYHVQFEVYEIGTTKRIQEVGVVSRFNNFEFTGDDNDDKQEYYRYHGR